MERETPQGLPDEHQNVFIMILVIPPPLLDGNLDFADLYFGFSGEQTFDCILLLGTYRKSHPNEKSRAISGWNCQISLPPFRNQY